MRTLTSTIILFVLATVFAWQCGRPVVKSVPEIKPDDPAPLRASVPDVIKGLKDPGFSKNELIVFFNGSPSRETIDEIKQRMKKNGIDPASITIRRCNVCAGSVQLWQAPDIYTYVMSEGVRSGSGGGTPGGVGEDGLARYSLNYYSYLPMEPLPSVGNLLGNYNKQRYPVNNLNGKDVVKIAVLDTGIDTLRAIQSSYLWRNNRTADCYPGEVAGWNFLDNNADFREGENAHGTVVTKYIIDEFRSSSTRGVQIMALKTHDRNGRGTLFANICALYYAIENGAQMVNASWGFYNYFDNPVPYLDSLVTKVLPAHGILFVTAAGNKLSDDEDNFARARYRLMHGTSISDAGLRNLQIHNFYPAMFSRPGNNVITTTTTNGTRVSPTQNFSSLYVDLGVQEDRDMRFRAPFDRDEYISGSSFATAIATGKIGVGVKSAWFQPGISKNRIFEVLGPTVQRSAALNDNLLIRDGRYINRR